MSFEVLYMQIICLGLLLLCALFGGRLSRKFNLGEVVGQVLGGLLAGPVFLFFLGNYFHGYAEALESLHFFTFLFLGVIVFGIGDELSLPKLKKAGKDALIICVVQAVSTWAIITVAFILLGLPKITSFIIGSIGIATAPAATFVIMNKLGIAGRMRSMLGSIVVVDDVLEVIIFSITVQVALALQKGMSVSGQGLFLPIVKDFSLAIVLGFALYLLLRAVVDRKWLRQEETEGHGPMLGHEFLSRLISEMPGPSIEILVLVGGCVSIAVGLALHWHLPFLITAICAGVLISNFYSRQVFEALRIENATSMYTLVFFALIGANARFEAFAPDNLIFIAAYVLARGVGKVCGTWVGCKLTKQEARFTHIFPRLMLPQAGVAAIEAFFVATVLGQAGDQILQIILPGLIIFEIVGVLVSEQALLKWRSWETGGGELIGEEETIKRLIENDKLKFYDLLHPECLKVPFKVNTKGEAIWDLIIMLERAGFITNPGYILEKILERERQGGTTLGEGVAILHCRVPNLIEPAIALGVLSGHENLIFSDAGNVEVNIIYMVLSPESAPELHIQILASIARFLSDTDLRTRLRYAKGIDEALEIIKEHSEEMENK